VGQIACIGEIRNLYKILVKKLEGKRHERPSIQKEGNIKMYLTQKGW
jgi:hypothetical protein